MMSFFDGFADPGISDANPDTYKARCGSGSVIHFFQVLSSDPDLYNIIRIHNTAANPLPPEK